MHLELTTFAAQVACLFQATHDPAKLLQLPPCSRALAGLACVLALATYPPRTLLPYLDHRLVCACDWSDTCCIYLLISGRCRLRYTRRDGYIRMTAGSVTQRCAARAPGYGVALRLSDILVTSGNIFVCWPSLTERLCYACGCIRACASAAAIRSSRGQRWTADCARCSLQLNVRCPARASIIACISSLRWACLVCSRGETPRRPCCVSALSCAIRQYSLLPGGVVLRAPSSLTTSTCAGSVAEHCSIHCKRRMQCN